MTTNGVVKVTVGTRFAYDEQTWRVVALDGTAVRARDSSGRLSLIGFSELMTHADFSLADDNEEPPSPVDSERLLTVSPAGLIDAAAPSAAKAAAARKAEAVNLLLTGFTDGVLDPQGEPHAIYGPQNGQTLDMRIRALAVDRGVGFSTVERWIRTAREHGTEALIDKRTIGVQSPLGHCPQEVVDAMITVASAQAGATRVTDQQLLRQVRRLVQERHGDAVVMPKPSTLRRYFGEFKKTYGLHLATKTRQGNSLRPDRIGPPLVLSRPFELVEIDSTPFDVLAISEVDGQPMRVVLTLAIDVFSRSLVAWQFSPLSDKGIDAALLLHDMLTPKAWLPEWSEHARWRYGIPETLVLPGNIQPLAGVPVGVPTTVSLDNGRTYASNAMQSACVRLGISLQYSRVKRPTDKPHIERVFATIRTRFAENLPGYVGPRVDYRGTSASVEGRASLFIGEIEGLFAQWVATEYQNRPHKGLVSPVVPKLVMTPNEMFDAGIAAAGYMPLVANPDLAISLLPSVARRVNVAGIEISGLMYDSPVLDPYRRRTSPFESLNGKWPVRSDPRDLSHVWFWAGDFRDPLVGEWKRIPARITRAVGAFADVHLEYAKSLFTDADRQTGRTARVEAVEETMLAMFTRVRNVGPAHAREATVFRLGDERTRLALNTFPHPTQSVSGGTNAGSEADSGLWDVDLDDLEPFPMADDLRHMNGEVAS